MESAETSANLLIATYELLIAYYGNYYPLYNVGIYQETSMKLKVTLAIALVIGSVQITKLAHAEDEAKHDEASEAVSGGEDRGGHGGGGFHAPVAHAPARPLPPRAAPPAFRPHPHEVPPHVTYGRPHPIRVLRPTVIRYGHGSWAHWAHPEFVRPLYYWDWMHIHSVNCIAEDAYGDQYPVTESAFSGFGLVNMTAVEDDAIDRCYAESGGDNSCYLATCTHF